MSKIKKATINETLDLSKYHNSETGELLSSELVGEGKKITIEKDTGMMVVNSDDYAVIDSKAFLQLIEELNNADLAHVVKMFPLTKTEMNIIYNNNVPHTNATLQEYLKIGSQSKFSNLVKRLIKVGVIYQIKGNIYGRVRTIYMLNPFISRKRKTISEDLTTIFKNFK